MAPFPQFSDYGEEARFHLEQANECQESGNLKQALEECDLAILIDPDLADAHNLRGIILEGLGKPRDAIRSYKKAIKLDAEFAEAKENLQDLEPKSPGGYDLVTIATFSHSLEASLVKARLESEGIFVFLADQYMVTMNWLYSNAIGGVRLQVPETEVERALQILAYEPHKEEFHEAILTDSADHDRCPKCESINTEYHRFETRLVFLSWLLLSFPLPFFKRKWKCNDCGNTWK